MKSIAFILLAFFAFQTSDNEQLEKMAKAEAKLLCSCYKTFDKKQAKFEKKSPGETLKFSVTDCLKDKRSSKISNFIDNLSEEDNSMFKRLVFQNIDSSCPNVRTKN